MSTYQSNVKTISSAQEVVFCKLIDLQKLKIVLGDDIRSKSLKDVHIESESFSFTVDGIGKVGFRITEKVPHSVIRLESFDLPVSLLATVHLKELTENETELLLSVEAELPLMIKMMIGNKLEPGINALADLIAKSLNK